MATSNEKRQTFKINHVFPAVISKIKDDRVFFSITRQIKTKEGSQTITEMAAFFLKGHRLNPHQVFCKGQQVSVTVLKLFKPAENYYGLCYMVVPEFLPTDCYIAKNPIGSTVTGTIDAIHGSTMTVMLAPNVFAITKRSKHARTGCAVDCKIDRFNKQRISLRIFE